MLREVLSWGAQVPPCLWQEQLQKEKKDVSGLGHNLNDPAQPFSFTLSMEHSKPGTGRAQGSVWDRRATGLL